MAILTPSIPRQSNRLITLESDVKVRLSSENCIPLTLVWPKADESGEGDPSSVGFEEPRGGASGSGDSQYEMIFSEDEILDDPEGGYLTSDESGDGAEAIGLPPFHNMYVDTKFEPIASEEVLKVVKGAELPESHLELIIAKRLPVRIGLRMDERKISDFMAACINSPFSFEIQQVRINRHAPGAVSYTHLTLPTIYSV